MPMGLLGNSSDGEKLRTIVLGRCYDMGLDCRENDRSNGNVGAWFADRDGRYNNRGSARHIIGIHKRSGSPG